MPTLGELLRFLTIDMHWTVAIASGGRSALRRVTFVAGVLASVLSGCVGDPGAPATVVVRGAAPEVETDATATVVSAERVWTRTGLALEKGQRVTVSATGSVVAYQPSLREKEVVAEVGPEGTYLFSDRVADREFPLPAAGGGPAPCYGLIGRIGGGAPFFIGTSRTWTADRGGELWLGVNDFDVSDNSGEFLATIDLSGTPRPVFSERVISRNEIGGSPADGCSVVVFYVDGLRPDVVREMAALGHLPNIKRRFLEGGTWLSNTFTAFPSDTITSNGTMWTGCFSDRHGMKGQVGFSRRRQKSISYLDPFGPQRSAQWLSPHGIDGAVQNSRAGLVGLIGGDDAREAWLDARRSSVAPLYEHLQNHGLDWASGVLPVMTEVPPVLWSRSLARHMPYLQPNRAWESMDDANADYAVKNLLGRREAVTVIWLPETDTCSHKCSRGQFGMTRRTIAKADRLLGSVVEELRAQGRLQSTYLMLVSDHGHLGGRERYLSHFDLATDFFFRPREVDDRGEWIGGGFGLSVRMHRYENRHPGDSAKEFVFIDGDSDGVARISLPRGEYRSGDWSGPNDPSDLLRYRIDAHRDAIDLPRSVASIRAVAGNGEIGLPIDLVLMKLDATRVLITTADRGQSVIERRRGGDGRWEYRYFAVADAQPRAEGGVDFNPVAAPKVDPLRLVDRYAPSFLFEFHDERRWLELTAETEYPDSVVSLARHMLWDERMTEREREYAPDLVVTARAGWYFGTEASPGTMHGYPLAEATRASWFVSGPRVRRGARIETPCRLADLTPTILDMVGLWDEVVEAESDGSSLRTGFDGRPVRDVYAGRVEYVASGRAVLWEELDLGAWDALEYSPLDRSELLPRSIHDPDSMLDVNNLAYSAASIGDLSVVRLLDDVVSPLSGGREPVTGAVERTEAFVRRRPNARISQVAQVPNVSGLSLADYSFTSQGNLQRVDEAIDWVQLWGDSVDQSLGRGLKRETVPIARPVNRSIDAAQTGFWELYRFGQRVVIKLVDEQMLTGLEKGTDRMLNAFRRVPAEIPAESAPKR